MTILVTNTAWFLHFSVELGIFSEEATFSPLLMRPLTKTFINYV